MERNTKSTATAALNERGITATVPVTPQGTAK